MLALAAGMAVVSLVRADGGFAGRRAAGVADRRRRNVAGVHPIARHRDLLGQARGGRAGVRIVNTGFQGGSALGLAVMTAIATSQGADKLRDLAALTDRYQAAFIGAAVIAAAGALLAAALLRIPKAGAADSQREADEAQVAIAA